MDDVEKGSNSPSVHSSSANHDDLEASCAKIWTVYISEAEKYDKALVESWRGDMDGMLIFAGLFSASLTAFIIESYKTLTPDSGDTAATLLNQISMQLAANANGTTFLVPSRTEFVVPITSVICNILWFLSLGLSLACALIATLVEQWARDFVQKAEMRPSPAIRARIFSYLYYGLKRFNMHILVDLVPFLLHMSLVLFFTGLVAFLLPISGAVTAVSIALLGIVVAVYSSLTILPLIYFDCPYRTPLSAVLWRVGLLLSSRIAALRYGKPQEHHSGSSDDTMAKAMISRATRPSAERDQRDRHSLCWTVKSLVGPEELEPFIDSIYDVLWGPDGRKHTHDHFICTLLDDTEVRLGNRILEFMLQSNSGLLTPAVELRHKITCLKTLWSICTLAERGTRLNVPFHTFPTYLDWHWIQKSSNFPNPNRELENYAPAAQALLDWGRLCSLDFDWQELKADLQKCQTIIVAGSIPSFDTVQTRLDRLSQDSQSFLKFRFGEVQLTDAKKLSANTPSTLSDASAWFQEACSLLRTSEPCWDDVQHCILRNFLNTSIGSDDPNILFGFDSTVELLQSQLSPPSTLEMYRYAEMLGTKPLLDGAEMDDRRRHKHTAVFTIILSFLFPLNSLQPPTDLGNVNAIVSILAAHLPRSEDLFYAMLQRCSLPHIWAALMEYIRSGCPQSNDAETTSKVLCFLDNGLWRLGLVWRGGWTDPLYLGLDSDSHRSFLSTLSSIPDCPPLPSLCAVVKTRFLVSLRRRELTILAQLATSKNLSCTLEFHEKFRTRWRQLSTTHPLPETFISPCLPTGLENMIPSQSDWDESKSILSHPLLSDSELTPGLNGDSNFDYRQCEDDVEKTVQYLALLSTTAQRIKAAQMILCTEFLEACSAPIAPYKAILILLQIEDPLRFYAEASMLFNVFLAPRNHRIRFVNSLLALLKVRDTTPDHEEIWRHVITDSPFLGTAIFEEARRAFERYGIQVSSDGLPSELLVIKNALTEYAESINVRNPSRKILELRVRVQEIVGNLDALLDTFPSVPVE